MSFHVPERYRFFDAPPPYASDASFGNNGLFLINFNPIANVPVRVIASDGNGWDHVSVSLQNRCPTWEEMCWVKDLFWDAEDACMQLHPPQSEYVNFHPNCLHLWRPNDGRQIPLPPSIMVGPKT